MPLQYGGVLKPSEKITSRYLGRGCGSRSTAKRVFRDGGGPQQSNTTPDVANGTQTSYTAAKQTHGRSGAPKHEVVRRKKPPRFRPQRFCKHSNDDEAGRRLRPEEEGGRLAT